MKFGAFVITCDRAKALDGTMRALFSQTRPPEHVLIIDNGASNDAGFIAGKYPEDQVTRIRMKENRGPAGAAAFGLEWFTKKGCDMISWGDDDDPPPFAYVFERLISTLDKSGKDVAGVGAVGHPWDWRTGRFQRLPDHVLHGTLEVDTIAGNCQLIVRRSAVHKVGLPDTRLFFGFEEPEYCLRIRRAGYRLAVDGDLMLEYRARAGRLQLKKRRSLLSAKPRSTIWRQYYATRNYIYVMRCTFNRPDLACREMMRSMIRTILCWGRGGSYGIEFSRMQLRGVIDGYMGRMGRTLHPNLKYS